MPKKEKAEEVVRRMGAYGVRPGPKYPELADAILRLLDVVDRRVAKKDAEIEQLQVLLSHWYEMWNDGIPNPDGDVLLDTQAALAAKERKRKPTAQEVFAAFDNALALSETETWTGNKKHNSPEDRMARHKAWAKVNELRAALAGKEISPYG